MNKGSHWGCPACGSKDVKAAVEATVIQNG